MSVHISYEILKYLSNMYVYIYTRVATGYMITHRKYRCIPVTKPSEAICGDGKFSSFYVQVAIQRALLEGMNDIKPLQEPWWETGGFLSSPVYWDVHGWYWL